MRVRVPTVVFVLVGLLLFMTAIKIPILAFDHPEPDEVVYWQLTENFLKTGHYSLQGTPILKSLSPGMYDRPLFHHPPMYSFFLVPFVVLNSVSFAVLVSWLGHFLAVVGVALFAVSLARSRGGEFSGWSPAFWLPLLGLALDPFFLFNSRKLWMDNLLAGWVTLAVGLSLWATQARHRRGAAVEAGIALGCAALTKLSAFFAAPVLVLSVCLLEPRWRERIRLILWMASAAAVLALPWYITFYAQYGALFPSWTAPDAWLREHYPFIRMALARPWFFYLKKVALLEPFVWMLLPLLALRWSREAWIPLAWFGLIWAPFTLAGMNGFTVFTRHLTPAYPALYCLIYVLTRFPEFREPRKWFALSLLMMYGGIAGCLYLTEMKFDEILSPLELVAAAWK